MALRRLQQVERAHLRLRRVFHQARQAQENERRKISRALHDDISQLLVGLEVHLANFARMASLNPRGIGRRLQPLRRLVKQSAGVVHRFARELRPAMLDDLGLDPALRYYLEHLPRPQRRRIKLISCAAAEGLSDDKRTVLYRVFEEALVNVAKHAPGSSVTVALRRIPRGISLEITDTGQGFTVGPLSSAAWNRRLGLIAMRERVEMVGGRFRIGSRPGAGTTVRAEIPFRANFSAPRVKTRGGRAAPGAIS